MFGRLSLCAALASTVIALAGTAFAGEEPVTTTTEETAAEAEASPEATTGEETPTDETVAEEPAPPVTRLVSYYAYICSLELAIGATPETISEATDISLEFRILEEWEREIAEPFCYRVPSIAEKCGSLPGSWICLPAPPPEGATHFMEQ